MISGWVTLLIRGVTFDFGVGGVDRFRILGIETSAGLNPTDPTAFVTGLTFTGVGAINMSQNPITVDTGTAPEPEVMLLVFLGCFGFLGFRKKVS